MAVAANLKSRNSKRSGKEKNENSQLVDLRLLPYTLGFKGILQRVFLRLLQEPVSPPRPYEKFSVVRFRSLSSRAEKSVLSGWRVNRLVAEDIIEPVTYSDWATPIVPVIKQNGNLRICGDYKVTINPGLKIEQYPLPRIEDIFAELSGGEFFTKIDLSEAYLQMLVDEQDRHLLTINAHKGLFRYKRMNYGIALAPAEGQRAIEQVLSGIAGVHVFLDDITVTGRNDQEHFERLELVLQRLEEYGLRVNKRKSEFFKKSVNYCGHTIDKFGLHKTQEKIDAIMKVPVPKTVSDLKSFLGLVNYYGKFIPNLSTRVALFNNLLQKGTKFLWTAECEKDFKALKQEIASDRILCHYNPKLPLVLQTDASPVGIGAVLSHIMPDGSEKPEMFASRSLTKTERNYSQIDKEALSIVWGVKRFYQYLFGRHFDLVTDHKPLVSIFAPNRSLPCLSATRMVHYALFLQAFSYTIKYRNTKNHGNADALSRLPLAVDKDCEYLTEADVTNISQVELMPVTAIDIARTTKTYRKLFELYESLKSGTELPVPWKGRESEFSLQNGCIMYGHRVCIPEKYQNQVLEELHVGHPGIVKMKVIARSYCYWQGIDASIANFVKNCSACIATRNEPARINRHPWEWPNGPWQRIHVDYACPFMGKMFFVVSDAYSKWIKYRITPHSLTGETPSALFLKRCIRTRLDLFKPNLRDKVVQKQSSRLDTESILREFQEGEKVAVRNYSGPNKWKTGTIINRDGTLSYSKQIGNEIWKRQVDQIRKCEKSIELSQVATEIPIYDKELNFPDEPVSDDVAESEPPAPVPEVVPKPKDVPVPATPSDDIPPKPVPDASVKPKTDVPLRRSNRIRRPPKRLDL
ncbi:transposon Tf2-11 polyprotein [Trichonephila clavipes]|nr:transposon Tf2-11 polyprotein [Trichonephila clavipes]